MVNTHTNTFVHPMTTAYMCYRHSFNQFRLEHVAVEITKQFP